MKTKVTVEEAWDTIATHALRLPASMQKLSCALGLRLAEEVFAPISLPPFDNSAVDGYALGSLGTSFQVVATIGAGENYDKILRDGEACRIMTGAKIPQGTCAVAMQENVRGEGAYIELASSLRPSENIRRAGEDVRAGSIVAYRDTKISPAHIGLLAALGIPEVKVRKRPSVAIVSTGSELVEPGLPLSEGQVYYCTGPMLSALCSAANCEVGGVAKIDDDKVAIVEALQKLSDADILLMVGGMANGLYDHGRYAFEKIGVEPLFFEGQWRPGKPLFFGKLGNKLVFGLPGNPVAAYVMFKIFIEPAINALSGGLGQIPWKQASLRGEWPSSSGKSLFLRARLTEGVLDLLPGQGSHQMFTLSQANAIAWISGSGSLTNYLPIEA